MSLHSALRLLAGTMVLISLILTHYVHPNFWILTAFVGLNLFQSAFTNKCPAISFFRWLGLREDCAKS